MLSVPYLSKTQYRSHFSIKKHSLNSSMKHLMQWNLQFWCNPTFWTRWFSQNYNSKLLRRLKFLSWILKGRKWVIYGEFLILMHEKYFWRSKSRHEILSRLWKITNNGIVNGYLRISKSPITANSISCIFTYIDLIILFANCMQEHSLSGV